MDQRSDDALIIAHQAVQRGLDFSPLLDDMWNAAARVVATTHLNGSNDGEVLELVRQLQTIEAMRRLVQLGANSGEATIQQEAMKHE